MMRQQLQLLQMSICRSFAASNQTSLACWKDKTGDVNGVQKSGHTFTLLDLILKLRRQLVIQTLLSSFHDIEENAFCQFGRSNYKI